MKVRIFNIERRVRVFVINKKECKYDLVLGIDSIKTFRLCQDHELKITQAPLNDSEDIESTEAKENIDSVKNVNELLINWNESIPVEKFEAKTAHLESSKKKAIHDFVDKYSAVFAKNQFDVGTVNGYEAHINLMEDRYISKKPYRCTYADQEEIERQVAELLEHGMIEESCSPFAAPVTLAYKKTGENGTKEKTRMCIDFRELNKILIPEIQPFPLIDDIIVKTRDCNWFSALDINSAFWSIPICREDRYKTGFVTQQGQWHWVSLPFGLKNASAIFQRILSGIIRKNKLGDFCTNYIDDILIFSRTFEEHLKHLEALVEAILKEGFRLKFVKCSFATHSVQYLGHVIERNSVRPLNDNLISIRDFPTPRSRKNIRQFLGKINFYHKFIENAASTLEVFHNLLRKNVPFIWSDKCQEAFDKIKKYLTSSPVLAIFDRAKPITIYSDASGVGIGAILKQMQDDGSERPVAYFSKKLNESQQKQKAVYIESLAIREAIKYWRYWLIGRRFTVITDHKPLENLNLRSRTDEELGDLANYLLQYDFEIIYRPGSKNGEADCLSRNPVLDSSHGEDTPDLLPTVNLLQLSEIEASQKQLEIDIDRSSHIDGIIVRSKKGRNRILLDTEYGKLLIEKVHLRYGHIGTQHVYNIIRKYFTFDHMHSMIQRYCSACEICIKNKSRKPRDNGLLGYFGPAETPYHIMSLDTVGGFGGRRSTKRYLHLLVDHFSRFAFVITSQNQNAAEFIRLVDSVQKVNKIGILLTDQYGGLNSREFTDYLQGCNVDHYYTAVDSPSSNGANERLGQTLVNRIRCKINEQGNKNTAWTTIARKCVDEYNSTIHSVTNYAPNYLLHGTLTDMVPLQFLEVPDLLADRKIAFRNSVRYHEANKRRCDKNKRDITFNVGDMVYVENGNRLNRHKLDELRIGPFPIVKKLSNTVYEIDVGYKTCSKRLYHANKIIKIDSGND